MTNDILSLKVIIARYRIYPAVMSGLLLLVLIVFATHPCRVRRIPLHPGSRLLERFNPRTRVGCDISRYITDTNKHVSIHAPV